MPHGLRDPIRAAGGARVFCRYDRGSGGGASITFSARSLLRISQGMDSCEAFMEDTAREIGHISGTFTFAEGWRRHLHLGFSITGDRSLAVVLSTFCRSTRITQYPFRSTPPMPRKLSHIAPDWWDYHHLDNDLINDAARLTERSLSTCPARGSRSFSTIRSRISTWPRRWNTSTPGEQATADNPVGICGPIGPTEQLPLVARLVNELDLDLAQAPTSGAWTNG